MMLTDQLRTRQGPLGRAWLASHWERKISKSQFIQTNLKNTIDVIETNQEEEPMTLRISGQLLLGVVRIYSRKTKYLLDDCNEALMKIKLAFKQGEVNMPDIHNTMANTNTITLQNRLTGFDILLPEESFQPSGNNSDPLLDGFGDISSSDNITFDDMNNSFSFGQWNTEQGVNSGVEAGRRDVDPGFADNEFSMDLIEEPLKDMNLNDGHGDDIVDFDFDLNDNVDYTLNDMLDDNRSFDFDGSDQMEASLDTLMHAGLMPVDDSEQLLFDTEPVNTTTVRKRKILVVDKVTEIPNEELRRYMDDTSSIVNKNNQRFSSTAESNPHIDLYKPALKYVTPEFEKFFSRKRRASLFEGNFRKESRLDDQFTTPRTEGYTPFNDVDYDVDIDAGNFNQDYDHTDVPALDDFDQSFMTQSSQPFNSKTLRTLSMIEEQLVSQPTVKFSQITTESKKSVAASLFYDVLLLSTKNKIRVNQDSPYSEIHISAVTLIH
ncbi:Rec8 like protein-domain-containing protein [Pilobolus umbonatus]|nr:Rec8 like protein-domain-containing protein [Pilobolus umbonatus]